MLTITDHNARVRGGPPGFVATQRTIPAETRIIVLEEQTAGGQTYLRVSDRDSGMPLGWTLRSNAEDLDQTFKAARAAHVYRAKGYNLMVYVPQDRALESEVDVFVFFHGNGGDFATTRTNKAFGGYADNTAISADLPAAVTASDRNVIAIGVQANNKDHPEWRTIAPAQYAAMVDSVLRHLRVDLALPRPFVVSAVSLAGHSAGGMALGPAAMGLDAQDVTLQDAGYGYDSFQASWSQLRQWFVSGNEDGHVKQLRIISKDHLAGADDVNNTLHVHSAELSRSTILALAQSLHPGKVVTCPAVAQDKATPRDAGMTLLGGFDLLVDGQARGRVRTFAVDLETAGGKAHWAVKDETMVAAISAGDADDEFGVNV